MRRGQFKGFTRDKTQMLITAKRSRRKPRDTNLTLQSKNVLPPKWFDGVDEVKDNIMRLNELCIHPIFYFLKNRSVAVGTQDREKSSHW